LKEVDVMPNDPDTFIAGLVDDLVPVRPLRQRRGMGWAMAAMAAGAVGLISLTSLRADFARGQPDALGLLSTGLFLVLALASAWAVVDMARPQVGSRREGWIWTALMAALLPLSALALMGLNQLNGASSGLLMDGTTCLKYGLIWGLLTAGVLVLWLRRGAPAQPARAGLLIGVAAGSAGSFAVSLYCPHSELIHIGVWHGLTVVLAGLVGRLAIPPLVRW
jgi:hypothetical protein